MRALYMDNMNLKEWNTKIKSVTEDSVELYETAFYPESGGVAHDKGKIILLSDNREYDVLSVKKINGKIMHFIGNHDLKENNEVKAKIDWERRYKLMRMHTSAHLLSALFHNIDAKITGNSIDTDKSRMDFSIENFDRQLIENKIEEANILIEKGAQVTIKYMNRDDALKIPSMVKLAGALPPNIEELRVVTIEGIDEQADGGCHVSNIKEIGKIVLEKVDNKGAKNRRLSYSLNN
jgi:misacylated tRNA(Ala) deacylase